MLNKVRDSFDLQPERLIADTAQGTGPILGQAGRPQDRPHLQVLDKPLRIDGTLSRAKVKPDAGNNR